MIGYELTVFAVMSVTVMLFLLDGVLINKVGRVAYILSIIFIAVCGKDIWRHYEYGKLGSYGIRACRFFGRAWNLLASYI